MIMNKLLISLVLVLWLPQLRAQDIERRLASLVRIEDGCDIRIDGSGEEEFWDACPSMTDYRQRQPDPGAMMSLKTETRIAYDNRAIYIFARLYESALDSITSELSVRDEIFSANTDIFGIYIDPFQSGRTALGFFVTPANIQADILYTSNDEDPSWNPVWKSATAVSDQGWTVEIEIPYSMLRFPKSEEQIWNINLFRRIRRKRETGYYNFVNPEIEGLLNQFGHTTTLSNLDPPLRLSLLPYATTIVSQNTAGEQRTNFRGGMDIKWGLDESFTLDMTLIPDFSQVRTDDQVLNLDPFEVAFQENRAFFQEGAELFNQRRQIFYSRRIGLGLYDEDAVDNFVAQNTSYEAVEQPANGRLLNAIKLSGRTDGGLGVGVLNAVVNSADAILRNRETGSELRLRTQPLTNYSMVVLDQNLANNSSLNFTNTLVMREGDARDAYVGALDLKLRDKKQRYELSAYGALSNKFFPDSVQTGYRHLLLAKKISGEWRWEVASLTESRHYDTNDMGLLFAPNEQRVWVESGYFRNKPWGNYIRGNVYGGINLSGLQDPSVFVESSVYGEVFLLAKNFWGYGLDFEIFPWGQRDYFEPRREDFDRYLPIPLSGSFGGFVSTNYAKTFAIDVRGNVELFDEAKRWTMDWTLEPRFRFSDRLSIINTHEISMLSSDQGWLASQNSTSSQGVIIGDRDQIIFSNAMNAKYTLSSSMNLNLRARHYWTQVAYDRFYTLMSNSTLAPTDYDPAESPDINFNTFNLDMNLTWRFAPGSDFILAWTHQIDQEDGEVNSVFTQQFGRLFRENANAAISLRLVYFLDYEVLKNKYFSKTS